MFAEFLNGLFGVNLFGYISFRMAMAAATAFVLALWWGRPTIAWLRAHQVREDVAKSDSPELAEAAAKSGKDETTTMGGSFLVAALLVSVMLWSRVTNVHAVLAVLLVGGLAAVGFVDDYKKLTIPGCKGLSRKAKMFGLSVVVGSVLVAYVYYAYPAGRYTLLSIYPPFFKDAVIPLPSWGIAGLIVFGVFQWFVVVGTSNATNITDGLDGLAAGCMIITGLTLSIFCYVTGRPDWTGYLNLPHVEAASEMAVVGGALCGACMGFLWYNAYPAKVFMGDSGSLPLGGLLAWMALVSKQELVLPLIGCVFFIALGTSWWQTFWYKRTGGKRFFSIAPIHHGLERHGNLFEKTGEGWHEVTVVVRFWIIAAVGAMAGLALMKVR